MTSSFELDSTWSARDGRYQIRLHNRGPIGAGNFRLGFCGPVRISADAAISGGSLVTRLSNWTEIAPPQGLTLPPDTSWSVEFSGMNPQLHHWTDGATSAAVILEDGRIAPVRCAPARQLGDAAKLRLGPSVMEPASATSDGLSLLPFANSVEIEASGPPPEALFLHANDAESGAAVAGFAGLTTRLFPGEIFVTGDAGDGLRTDLACDPALGAENYELSFEGTCRLTGGDRAGLLYGLVSLGQMLRGSRRTGAGFGFPAEGRIKDAPRFGWRGCHLDVARRFYTVGELEKFLDVMAWNKLNRFHWHLSDDENFRIALDGFPQIAESASRRGMGLAVPPLLGSEPAGEAGIYAKPEAARIIAHAQAVGIEVIPEIDMPGHCYALLQALPQLRDPDETGTYCSVQGFPNNCLNPARPKVYEFVEAMLDELCALFPSQYLHVGADEVPKDAWQGSPAALELSAELGGGTAQLQAHFLQKVQEMLKARGKTTGAWEEAAEGGGIDRSTCYLNGWRSPEKARKLAVEAYDVVVCPGQVYYLDMALSAEWVEPGASWAGHSSVAATYAFDPAGGWNAAELDHLLGIQACIWSEPMRNPAVFDRLVFPRLSAIAETAWSQPGARDWRRFAGIAGLMPSLYDSRETGI